METEKPAGVDDEDGVIDEIELKKAIIRKKLIDANRDIINDNYEEISKLIKRE